MLARLKNVNLREAWPKEAIDFTNWLAKEENISLLSEELGLDISVISTEYKIGTFSVDIYAQNNKEEKIIIENQLEQTDHDHLGKLITYASGVNAKYIIWIVKKAREEHRSAIEWLNSVTNEDFNFFLVELNLWQIGDSDYAPKFNIVEKPNDWSKIIKSVEFNDLNSKYFEFWEFYNNYVSDNSKVIKARKPSGDFWTDYAIGTSKMYVTISNNIRNKQIAASIWIPNDKELYNHFLENKKEIEEELQLGELLWDLKPNKKASAIVYNINSFDLYNNASWEQASHELLRASEKMKTVFLKNLK